ncbi:hypothetical protein BKA70DRAFT_1229663 [Coprinopsis sp. MPI-PUGE-AT-0042]|nr:hypothetical protein BKA70DRAFT_1229663 [Coprinopsis sp. MPI-PUGE-AT-0042]
MTSCSRTSEPRCLIHASSTSSTDLTSWTERPSNTSQGSSFDEGYLPDEGSTVTTTPNPRLHIQLLQKHHLVVRRCRKLGCLTLHAPWWTLAVLGGATNAGAAGLPASTASDADAGSSALAMLHLLPTLGPAMMTAIEGGCEGIEDSELVSVDQATSPGVDVQWSWLKEKKRWRREQQRIMPNVPANGTNTKGAWLSHADPSWIGAPSSRKLGLDDWSWRGERRA